MMAKALARGQVSNGSQHSVRLRELAAQRPGTFLKEAIQCTISSSKPRNRSKIHKGIAVQN